VKIALDDDCRINGSEFSISSLNMLYSVKKAAPGCKSLNLQYKVKDRSNWAYIRA